MLDRVDQSHLGYGGPCNCISTLNNGVPTQVQMFLGPNVSRNDLASISGFVDDTWRVHRRVTLSLGLRLDRYQPILPAQEGPAGQTFATIDPVLTFNNWGPRVGLSGDLTGDGKTVLKLHYGNFWVYPGANFTAAFNPNPTSGWSRTYRWTSDANANGPWDPGEEGQLISVLGGSVSTRLDPDIDEYERPSGDRIRRARSRGWHRRPHWRRHQREATSIRHDQRQPAADRVFGSRRLSSIPGQTAGRVPPTTGPRSPRTG